MSTLTVTDYAIIALSAYNNDLKEGTTLGSATVIRVFTDAASGFSATAFNVSGEIVISYRGTLDVPLDLVTAYPTAIGFSSIQSAEAAAFYQNVSTLNPSGEPIVFTGHSLGGRLAGLMASLYGGSAVVFDSMTYEAAAENIVAEANAALSSGNYTDPVLATYYPGQNNAATSVVPIYTGNVAGTKSAAKVSNR